jgi:glycine betaine/proline transport system substrate-binding protein
MKDRWPTAHKIAKAYEIDTKELNAMSGQIDLEGKSIEDVAAKWIADNEATWRAWAKSPTKAPGGPTRPAPLTGG